MSDKTQTRTIGIKGTRKDFFYTYLHITKKLYEEYLSKKIGEKTLLQDSEISFLALVLFYNDKYKTIEQEDRMAFIFSTESKKKIQKELGVSMNRLDVMMNSLKTKGVVSKQGGIDKNFEVFAGSNKQNVLFSFNIVSDEDNKEGK